MHKTTAAIPINTARKKPPVIPFDFVIERLDSRSPVIKAMFGCYAIYVDDKIVLILRDRNDHTHDNGVWLATSEEYHEDLKKVFPAMRPIRLLGKKSVWQNIPASAGEFERSVMVACDMILKNDPRIGKVPGSGKKKIVRKR